MTIGRKTYWLALILAVTLMAAYVSHRDLAGRYRSYMHSKDNVQKAQKEVDSLTKAISDSRQHVEGLDKDPVEQEAAIRHIKNLVRPGETVYRIQPPNPNTGQAAPAKP
jgi:cell division protein FtsB